MLLGVLQPFQLPVDNGGLFDACVTSFSTQRAGRILDASQDLEASLFLRIQWCLRGSEGTQHGHGIGVSLQVVTAYVWRVVVRQYVAIPKGPSVVMGSILCVLCREGTFDHSVT